MRLVTFYPRSAYPTTQRLGAQGRRGIVDLAAAYRVFLERGGECEREAAARLAGALLPHDMVHFLEGGALARRAAEAALALAAQLDPEESLYDGEKLVYAHSAIVLLAPIPRPRSLRDFISFEQHIKNLRQRRGLTVPAEWYEVAAYYKGSTATIIGPNAEVVRPFGTKQLDYELELACVIGRSGRDIQESHAESHIAGYTVMNDFSARDVQFKEMNVGLGPAKGKDFATAFGPALITADEVPDPYNLTMIARVNGEEWSRGNSGTIFRKFPQLIAHASSGELLVPGDILGSGTVGFGCGAELGRFLEDGDVVELEIEGLGVLSNRIVGAMGS